MRIGIIGGGASGMIAAGTVNKDNEIYLLERNEKLGKKLYITGKGRCNITNNVDTSEFLTNVVNNHKFLYGALNNFSTSDCINLLNSLGLKIKIERGERVFPESDKSSDVIKALEKYVHNNNVNVIYNCNVMSVNKQNNQFEVVTNNGTMIFDRLIFACGGMSYPLTGSNGDGYKILESLGHNIVKPVPALVPIILKENVSGLSGVSLKNVKLSVYNENKVIFSKFGEMLFTENGLSGPIVLSASSYINRCDLDKLTVSIDLKPAINEQELDERLIKDFAIVNNRQFRNAIDNITIKRLIPLIIEKSEIDKYKVVNSITKQERSKLVNTIKNLTFSIAKLDDFSKAIITSGGVDVNNINSKTMESKIVEGLYICGEMVDVDAVTGGFNIQIAMSTGYLAGKNCCN